MTTNPKNDKERTERTLQLLHKDRIELLGEKLNKGYFETDDINRLSKYVGYAQKGSADFDDVRLNELKQELDKDLVKLIDLLIHSYDSITTGRYILSKTAGRKSNGEKTIELSRIVMNKCGTFLNAIQRSLDKGKSTISNTKKNKPQTFGVSQTPPNCFEQQGIGYIVFGLNGSPIRIGGVNNMPYRLLKYLTESEHFNSTHGIGEVFQAMIAGKDKRRYEPIMNDKIKMFGLIDSTFGELQRGKKVSNLELVPDNKGMPIRVRLGFRANSKITPE